ncbi:MAG: hypothetical protein HPKKFMNG_01050 [Planctomycetes bacterium]|nr:hypothetical protein [Planctomycetota bacterium]HRJ78287.1 hypothetical protein [Planctomycetota bacterium]
MTRWLSLLLVFGMAACASAPPPLAAAPKELLGLTPLKNLAGVPLKVPAIYFGDALGTGEALEIEKLDLLQLGRAALLAQLRERGYAVELAEEPKGRTTLHGAITRFDLDALKDTGRITLGMVVMVISAAGVEIGQAAVEREFQLMARAPNEGGALGEARFIEARLKAYIEALAQEAVGILAGR